MKITENEKIIFKFIILYKKNNGSYPKWINLKGMFNMKFSYFFALLLKVAFSTKQERKMFKMFVENDDTVVTP